MLSSYYLNNIKRLHRLTCKALKNNPTTQLNLKLKAISNGFEELLTAIEKEIKVDGK